MKKYFDDKQAAIRCFTRMIGTGALLWAMAAYIH